MKALLPAAAALSLAMTPALAQPNACLDAGTSRAMVDVLLPILIQAVAKRCGTDFAAQSPTLASARAGLSTRFAARAEAQWPRVRDWLKSTRGPDLKEPRDIIDKSGDAARPFVGAVITNMLGKELNARSCAATDLVLGSILPINDDQIGTMMESVLRVGLATSKKVPAEMRPCWTPPPK